MADNVKKIEVLVPAYLSYKTFQTVVEVLRDGPPQKIDRSVLHSWSGGVQSHILATFNFLKLIDSQNAPSDKLLKLVSSEGSAKQAILKEIVQHAYHFLFEGDLLKKGTAAQLSQKFQEAGASGSTIGRCITFFLKIAKDAGIELSPYFKKFSKTKSNGDHKNKKTASTASVSQEVEENPDFNGRTPKVIQDVPVLLLSKFPEFDPKWPDEIKTKWFEGFDKLMKSMQGL